VFGQYSYWKHSVATLQTGQFLATFSSSQTGQFLTFATIQTGHFLAAVVGSQTGQFLMLLLVVKLDNF
jgi:hypothetical protein